MLGSVALLAGCSSPGTVTPTTSTTTRVAPSSTTATTAAAPTTTTEPVPIQSSPTVRQQAAVVSCKPVAGGWEASGVATNPASDAHTYGLTVYFTDAAATVIGSGRTSVTVSGKSSGTWHVTGTFTASPPVKCVLVGVE